MALKSFCSSIKNSHVNIYIDYTTAVAYINAMGGTHSMGCNKVACDIWTWCIQRNIWVTAISLPGKENVDADKESRTFNDNTEWALSQNIFHDIIALYSKPSIDLFASRINKKVPCYILCHGSQIPKLNLLMHFLTPGLKNNFMPSLLLAWYFVAFRK